MMRVEINNFNPISMVIFGPVVFYLFGSLDSVYGPSSLELSLILCAQNRSTFIAALLPDSILVTNEESNQD